MNYGYTMFESLLGVNIYDKNEEQYEQETYIEQDIFMVNGFQ